jgi:uncharacterized paraquat-inducible protein A
VTSATSAAGLKTKTQLLAVVFHCETTRRQKTKENSIARCGIPLRDNEQTKENQLLAVVFQCGSSEADRALLLLMRDPAEFQAEF